jgi:hypothetical protein
MNTRRIVVLSILNAGFCYGLGFFIEELKFLWWFSVASIVVFVISVFVLILKHFNLYLEGTRND